MTLARLPQQILHRHLAIGEHQRAGRRSADAQLMFLRAHGQPRGTRLHQESGKLLAVDLGKDGKQAGDACIRNPHLFAIEHIMLAVGSKGGSRANVHCIGAGGGF